jgi:hypothetical protein
MSTGVLGRLVGVRRLGWPAEVKFVEIVVVRLVRED